MSGPTDMDNLPNPGSWDARKNGCLCPPMENNHGAGRRGDGGQYGWLTLPGCPMHGQPAQWTPVAPAVPPARHRHAGKGAAMSLRITTALLLLALVSLCLLLAVNTPIPTELPL